MLVFGFFFFQGLLALFRNLNKGLLKKLGLESGGACQIHLVRAGPCLRHASAAFTPAFKVNSKFFFFKVGRVDEAEE